MNTPSRLLAICLAAACLGAGVLASLAQAAPKPAWEVIAASGPTNLPKVQDEVQRLAVDAEGGTFTLTVATAGGTGQLSFGQGLVVSYASGATEITLASVSSGAFAAGQTLTGPGIAAGTTITDVSGNTITLSQPTVGGGFFATLTGASKEVSGITPSFGEFSAGQTVTGTGIPAGTVIEAVDAEEGALTLSNFPTAGGAQTLTVHETTVSIPFNEGASAIEAVLNGFPGVNGISVKGGPGATGGLNPYFVTFGGSHEHADVPQMTADSSGLTGGDNHVASITTAIDGGPGTSMIMIYPQNVGGIPSSGTTFLKFILPEGVATTETPRGAGGGIFPPPFLCGLEGTAGPDKDEGKCETSATAGPGFTLFPVKVPVKAELGAQSGPVQIKVWGGGSGDGNEATAAEYDMPLVVSDIPAPPGLQAFTAGTYDEEGQIDTRAGAHPYSASAGVLVNTRRNARGGVIPAGDMRDIVVETPPGFIGNAIAAGQCPEEVQPNECLHETIVAAAQVPLESYTPIGGAESQEKSPVNNIEAPFGYPAKFRFITGSGQIVVNVAASLRSDEDYGLEVGSYNTPQIKPVYGSFFTIWGTPADGGHDLQRCKFFDPGGTGLNCGPGGDNVAFLTNPVDCREEALRPPVATVNVNTWQDPTFLFAGDVALEPVTGCDELDFKVDKFAFEPGTDDADSPASFTTKLELPAEGLIGPEKRMNPSIKETVLQLPRGVVLNASAADGLEACSFDQIGYKGNDFPRPNEIRFTKEPNSCPDASKIGTGELKSSLIAEPLSAELFLAEQGDGNPFGSLFAIYLVVENPRNGIFIKLPGEVQLNEDDGRQRIVFRDLPPLPFDSLKLKLKGGDRSPLATPTTCGDYATTATNTPWSAPESGPPLISPSEFEIDEGPHGGGCADSPGERPFDIGLRAGTDSTQAGAFSPLTFQVTRPDGAQELNTLELAPPPGLAASLKGIAYCPEAAIAEVVDRDGKAEQDDPSCPAASRVGRALAGAGSGPRPYYAPGELYLAGPYKGAPLSIVAITPAVAGPFDLGNVVVRSAIFVDPVTAQVSAKTDPLPQIVKGVPLRIRDVRVILDRPGFSLNPSGCEEKAIGLRATGASGAVTNLATRFQVGNCAALDFKPQMGLRLFGGVKRGAYQGLRAVVRPRPGDANISRTVVRMPRSAFLAQEHIRTVCTRVQFAADACPKGTIYGKAVAWSPLLGYPLKGNVYLRSSDNELPDVVADLRGPAHQPIKVEVVGRTDSVNGALRNTFDVVPDAPVSYFRLQLFGGKKGLIVNSRNICRGKNRAGARLDAHNGRRALLRPVLRNKRCAMLRKKQRKAAKRRANRSKRPGA